MKWVHRAQLIVALTITTLLATPNHSPASNFFGRHPIAVRPGASFAPIGANAISGGFFVQPFVVRPNAYGPYPGQGLSFIQPGSNRIGLVPVRSFVFPNRDLLGRPFQYPYYYPTGRVPTTIVPLVDSSVIAPASFTPATPLKAPSLSKKKGQFIPGVPNYVPPSTIPLYRGPLLVRP